MLPACWRSPGIVLINTVVRVRTVDPLPHSAARAASCQRVNDALIVGGRGGGSTRFTLEVPKKGLKV